MATYTNYYNLEKPSLDEVVDVGVINENYDTIDEVLNNSETLASNIGSNYNSIISYKVGDYCIYNNNLYKCVQATTAGESFTPAKWQICKVTDNLAVANPSDSATTTLNKIKIDGTVYGISGGGGGGSTVVVTPTLQSGTKVADIEVDNVTSTLYAPIPTEVEANPSGTGSTTLTKLKVGSTTYNVPQGGGSTVSVSQTLSSGTEVAGITVDGVQTKLYAPTPTSVVANPSGQATTELAKLSVDGTIYAIPEDVEANPSSAGTTNLNKLRVGNTTYNIPNGGGSGDTVSWTQLTQSGTKIAEIDINGTSTDVYAPTSGGASSLSGLSDVDVSTVTDGQILKYDATNQEWVNANDGGGTTVIANPQGTPTDELNSIQIGSDIYSISGGGVGGILADKDILWEYDNSYDITLSYPFTDYDFLIFEGNNYSDIDHKGGAIISSTELEDIIGVSGKIYTFNGVIGIFANYRVDSTTSLTYVEGNAKVLRVWGIKFTSGGSSASWTDITGTLTAGQTEITFNSNKITTDSVIDVYTDTAGINYSDIEVSNGSVTLTYPEQEYDLGVMIRIWDDNSPYIFKEYIEASGNQSIDTGIDISSTTYFELKGAFTQSTNNNNMYGLGYANKESNVLVASNKIYNQLGGTTNVNIPYDTDDHIFKVDANTIYIDSTQTANPNWSNIPTGNRIRLFATAYDGTFDSNRISYAKIYYCKIYDDSTLVRDFIPVVRKSDNEIGMYDRVTNTFYTNSGTGSFIAI